MNAMMDSKYEDLTASGTDDGESNDPKENIDAAVQNNPAKAYRTQRNTMERKRKGKIIMYISQLKEMIPDDYLPSLKKPASNNTVLEQAVTYMRHLKEQSASFFSNNGTDAQRNEINRLKQELSAVVEERDKYLKMVQQAAAVTPKMLTNMCAEIPPDMCTKMSSERALSTQSPIGESSVQQMITSASTDRLPGQGLIITQSGQAYYVNEQGIPVAQGMAPVHLLSDNMMTKSTLSQTVTSTSTSLSQAMATPISAAVTSAVTVGHPSAENLPITSNMPNGLVALPGHTGQLPSAIILPNGQIIPVVTSDSTKGSDSNSLSSTAADLSSTVSTVTSTTVVSASPSNTDLTCSTTNTSGIMLIGGQPTLSTNTMANPTDISFNQLGRKIMPKPSPMIGKMGPMITPFTLAPLPIPACSISIAPTMFSSDNEPGKKKKTRKRKPKEPDASATKDILATATASIYTPKKDPQTTQLADVPSVGPAPVQAVPTSNPLQMLSTAPNPLNGVRARRTKKRKIKEAKKANSVDDFKKSTKSKLGKAEFPSIDPGNYSSPIPPMPREDCVTTEQSQAIEFDPNDLENILEQVENIEGMNTNSEPQTGVLKERETNNQSDYQVVTGDEEIGPVFTTSIPSGTPPSQPVTDISQRPADISDTASDSYLIGSLTKNREQPVDHRRQNQKDVADTRSRSDVSSGNRIAEFNSYQRSTPEEPFSKINSNSTENKLLSSTAMNATHHSSEQPPMPAKANEPMHQNLGNFDLTPPQSKAESAISVKPLNEQKKCESPMDIIPRSETSEQQYMTHATTVPDHNNQGNTGMTGQDSFEADLQHNLQQSTMSHIYHNAVSTGCTSSHKITVSSSYSPAASSAQSTHNVRTSDYPIVATTTTVTTSNSTSQEYQSLQVPYNGSVHSLSSNTLTTQPHSMSTQYSANVRSIPKLIATSVSDANNTGDKQCSNDIVAQSQQNPSKSTSRNASYKNREIHSTSHAPTAWSPAKEAENWPAKPLQSNQQFVEQNPSSLPYMSAHQQFASAQYSDMNHVKDSSNMAKSVDSSQSFHNGPYQYTQFAISNTNPISTDHPQPVSHAEHNASYSKQYEHRSQQMLQRVDNSSTSRLLGHDSTIWSTVSQSSENTSSYDHSRSSSGHESLNSQSSDPHAFTHSRSKSVANQSSDPHAFTHSRSKSVANQKSSRAKSVNERRNSSTANQVRPNVPDGLHGPPDSSYTQPYNNMYGLNSNISQSSRSHITSNSAAVSSKSSVFSAESILTKRKTSRERSKGSETQHQPLLPEGSSNVHTDARLFLQKDSFMTNPPYSAPFNVNLFAPSTQPEAALLSATTNSSFTDPSFTFSLTTTSCPSVSASSYEKMPGEISFPLQHDSRHNLTHDVDHRSMLSSATQSAISSSEILPQPPSHVYSGQFDLNPSNPYSFKPDPRVANSLQQIPPTIKNKQGKSHLPDSAKDLYSYSSHQYGIQPFAASQASEAAGGHLFNPQPIYNNPSVSLGLQFQHAGFTALPTRPTSDFTRPPTQINSPARFNINNIFREKSPIDPFKLAGNSTAAGSMYTPPHPNLYHNPMSIFGNTPGFDINRTPPTVAALAATNSSLTGFRHPLDFNVPSRP